MKSDCSTVPSSTNVSPFSYDACFSFAAIAARSFGIKVAKIATRSSTVSGPSFSVFLSTTLQTMASPAFRNQMGCVKNVILRYS
jgi:hypothetical protein